MTSIDQFVEEFWKPTPFPFNFEGDPATEIAKYQAFLTEKYGDTMEEYNGIEREFLENPEEGGYHGMNAFVMKSGLCDDLVFPVQMRSKETLRMLLRYFSSIDHEFTLADLGAGDGRMDLGFASYLDNLTRLYAVDVLPEAIERLEINTRKLPPEQQEKARRKIKPIKGDYESYLPKIEEKVDITLISYPLRLEGALETAKLITEGSIITCLPTDMNPQMPLSVKEILEITNDASFYHELKFKLLDTIGFTPYDTAVAMIAKA